MIGFTASPGQTPAFLRLIAVAIKKKAIPQAIWSGITTTRRSWL